MEVRNTWEEYSREEKIALLNHWVFYYGGIIMDLEDLNSFRKLSLTRQDDIFNHIVTNYIFRNTIQSNMLIHFLREGKIDELLSSSVSINDFSEDKKDVYLDVRNEICNEIVNSFIKPKKSEPMDIEIIVDNGKTKHM